MKHLILCLFICTSSFAEEYKIESSVVLIELEDKSSGSGVVVTKDENNIGLIATACHLFTDGSLKKITFKNGKTCSTAYIVDKNKKYDLAIVRSWIPDSVKPVQLASTIEIEDCKVIGYPFAKPETKPSRTVISYKDYIYMDSISVVGYSGGGSFTLNDELTGILSGGWVWVDDKNTQTWPTKACSVNKVRDLLKKIKENPGFYIGKTIR